MTEQIKQLHKKPSRKNPIILGTDLIDIQDTLSRVHDIFLYLSCMEIQDRDCRVSIEARHWISECALDALEFANEAIHDYSIHQNEAVNQTRRVK